MLAAGGTLGAGALLDACGSSTSQNTAAGTTELLFLCPGAPPTGWASVLAAVNKKLQTDGTGLALKIEWISWDKYLDTILLKATAGAKFDGVLTALWAHMQEFIADKAIIPLDSYVTKASHLQATIPDQVWNANKFGGKTYAVPMGSSYQSIYGFLIRKDLRLKYGMDQLKTMADLEKFLYMVKAREPKMVPYGFQKTDSANGFNPYPWENSPNFYHIVTVGAATAFNSADFYIKVDDPKNPKIVPFWEYPGYQEALVRTHRYVQDGIISKDAINLTGGDLGNLFVQGKCAVMPTTTDGTLIPPTPVQVAGAELEVLYPYTQPHPKPLNGFIMWNFVAVSARSAHPEKVIALLDWLSIKENHDLLEYGVASKDWKAVGDSSYTTLGQYAFPGYVISWRPSLERVNSAMLPDAKAWYQFACNPDNFTLDPVGSFTFDVTPVKTQVSQLSAALTQYKLPLDHGIVDPVSGLAQLQQAFQQAGYKQILAEAQKQAIAFVANK
jgi:putative aldouronate transport system substrate-binding protein